MPDKYFILAAIRYVSITCRHAELDRAVREKESSLKAAADVSHTV